MKIRFTERHVVKQGDGKGPVYEAGKVYSFDGAAGETYARKYVARGIAEEYTGKAKVPAGDSEGDNASGEGSAPGAGSRLFGRGAGSGA